MSLLPQQYGRILFELTRDKTGKDLDRTISSFVSFLRQEQVVSKIEYIIDAFVDYAKKESGIKKLNIKTAKKLSEKQLKSIVKHFGEKTEIEEEVDVSMLGGLVVREGNIILDGSLKRQLQRLKRQLS